MTDINRIRSLRILDKQNPHQIAMATGHSWATTKKYIEISSDELSKMGKRPNRQAKKACELVIEKIKERLIYEREFKVPRKQRITTQALYLELKTEGLFDGCEKYFRKIVKKQRHIFNIEKHPPKAFLQLSFKLGKYLQVDHGEIEVEYQGKREKAYLFCASVPGACLRYCQIYQTKSCESWGDFHERVFRYFGGIFECCIYDNDSVLKHPKTGNLTSFSLDLASHYNIEMSFCNKGKGNEKGSVENTVGYFKRNYCCGIPQIDDIHSLNEKLENKAIEEIQTKIHYKSKEPLQKIFEEVKSNLLPMGPLHTWGHWEMLKVSHLQLVCYKNNFYSVPEKFIGSLMKVHIGPFVIKIFNDGELICEHKRLFGTKTYSLNLDHFCDQLERKPRAIPFSKVFQEHNFPEYLLDLQRRLSLRFQSNRSDQEFIKILKLKRICRADDFEKAVKLGLLYGGITEPAIRSLISQLQIPQKAPPKLTCLPESLPVHLEKEFELQKYNLLGA